MSEHDENCVFCRIVRGEIAAAIVYQDELAIAFMDIGSINPGHMLVAAKAHVENIYGVDDRLAEAMMRATTRVARAVKIAIKPRGLSLFQANEAAGGQTVFHVHIHVIPRLDGDGLNLAWPARNPPREELDQVAERIRRAL